MHADKHKNSPKPGGERLGNLRDALVKEIDQVVDEAALTGTADSREIGCVLLRKILGAVRQAREVQAKYALSQGGRVDA